MIDWGKMEISRYLAAQVKRWHVYPVLRQQNIGEHSFNIMQIMDTIFHTHPQYLRLLRGAMHHDMGEIQSGDIPYGAKKSLPNSCKKAIEEIETDACRSMRIELPLLTQEEQDIIKFCDLAEMWLFSLQELCMGNRMAQPIRLTTEAELNRRAIELPAVYHEKIEQWRNENITTFGAGEWYK